MDVWVVCGRRAEDEHSLPAGSSVTYSDGCILTGTSDYIVPSASPHPGLWAPPVAPLGTLLPTPTHFIDMPALPPHHRLSTMTTSVPAPPLIDSTFATFFMVTGNASTTSSPPPTWAQPIKSVLASILDRYRSV